MTAHDVVVTVVLSVHCFEHLTCHEMVLLNLLHLGLRCLAIPVASIELVLSSLEGQCHLLHELHLHLHAFQSGCQ